MKKRIISNIVPILFTILVIYTISLLWNKITIPFENPEEVVGFYAINNHHNFNDTLRYILFVCCPLIVYFIFFFLLKKDECKSLDKIFIDTNYIKNSNNFNSYFYLGIFFFLIILPLFSSEFPKNKIDIFHEGVFLSGALNFDITNNLWLNSFSNSAIFYDVINTKIAWMITGSKSIGSMRLSSIFLEAFTSVLLIIFIFKLSKKFNFKENQEILSIVFLGIISLYLINKSISFRFIPLILFFIFSLNILTNRNKSLISSIGIGFLSIFSFLWSLEIGAFLNASIFFLIIILLFQKKYFNIFPILLGLMIGWIIFYLLISEKEFYEFLSNSLSIFKYHELLNGIIHPQPFFGEKNSSRATKSLIITILNGIILIELILSKKNKIPNNTKIFLLLFFISAFFNYKSGLSRSDGGHISNGGSLNLFLFLIFVNYFFLSLISYFKVNDKKFVKKRYLSIILVLLVLVLYVNVKPPAGNIKKISLENLLNFNSRYQEFIKQGDSFYLDNNYVKLVERLKYLTQNQNCFQVFTYEAIINYLIKKKSCTKYYLIWSIGSKKNQLNFIEEMKLTKPNYILYEGLYEWDFSPKERFPYIDEYLNKHYKVGEQFLDWKILYLK